MSPRARLVLAALATSCCLAGPLRAGEPGPAGAASAEPVFVHNLCLCLLDGSVILYPDWQLGSSPLRLNGKRRVRWVEGEAWRFDPARRPQGFGPRRVPLDSVRFAMTNSPQRLPGVRMLRHKNHKAWEIVLATLGWGLLTTSLLVMIALVMLINALSGL